MDSDSLPPHSIWVPGPGLCHHSPLPPLHGSPWGLFFICPSPTTLSSEGWPLGLHLPQAPLTVSLGSERSGQPWGGGALQMRRRRKQAGCVPGSPCILHDHSTSNRGLVLPRSP